MKKCTFCHIFLQMQPDSVQRDFKSVKPMNKSQNLEAPGAVHAGSEKLSRTDKNKIFSRLLIPSNNKV